MNNALIDFYRKLNREIFLDEGYKEYANFDNPLPIGFGQTISQPTLVLQMTMALEPDKTMNVLEVGTGSGYQTVFLAEFSNSVFTIERIESLSEKAQKRLNGLGYNNILFRVGDGSQGWTEYAPYNRIIVTAAAARIPQPLIEQLAPNGRMIIPLGESRVQELTVITKNSDGSIQKESLSMVRFVELVGEYGWNQL